MAEDTRYFQWVAGERRGEILVFDNIIEEEAEIYIQFKDGSRMNQNFIAEINQTDMTGKMMAEIDSPSNTWKFEEKVIGEETGRTEVDWESQVRYEIPSITEIASNGQKVPVKKKQVNLIPPRKTRPENLASRFGQVVMSQPLQPIVNVPTNTSVLVNTNSPQVRSVNQNDPVYIMMDKSKKVETEVEMILTISLPSESLYNVAKESFEDGAEKALEYIIENIDLSKIKEALKAGIKARYEQPDDIGGEVYEAPDYNADDALLNSMYETPETSGGELTLK